MGRNVHRAIHNCDIHQCFHGDIDSVIDKLECLNIGTDITIPHHNGKRRYTADFNSAEIYPKRNCTICDNVENQFYNGLCQCYGPSQETEMKYAVYGQNGQNEGNVFHIF